MNARDIERQEREWHALFERIGETLRGLAEQHAFGRDDYFILDDDWGQRRHEIEIQNLNLLEPSIVKALQALLSGYPEWEIAIGVDVVTKHKGWPAMGVIVRRDEIVDGLQREYLPQELQSTTYEGRVRQLGPAGPR